MIKKVSLVLILSLLFAGARLLPLRAQKDQGEINQAQRLVNIESRLAQLLEISRAQRELDKKLDRILANQDKILAELAIVKVRASKR